MSEYSPLRELVLTRIRSFLRERVAAYKVPKRVLLFDDGDIPMTGSATKVRDEALLAAVSARLEQNGDR